MSKRRCSLTSSGRSGQLRPTPLLLQYEPGDYNCLSQDFTECMYSRFYSPYCWPSRVEISRGGEFVLTEQHARVPSRPEVVPLRQWDAVYLPCTSVRCKEHAGVYKVNLRRDVSRIRSGRRHTVGVIFHGAT